MAPPTTSTAGPSICGVDTGVGAFLECVSVETCLETSGTFEHTVFHVGGAGRGFDAHRVTVHVNQAGDVNNSVWAECVLAPRFLDLTPLIHFGIRMDGSETAAATRSKTDPLAFTLGNTDGDERRMAIDPRFPRTPDNESYVVSCVVLEIGGIFAI